MSSLLNEHAHPVVDERSDGIFVIDPVDRTVTLEVDGTPVYFGGPVIVKGDINSERLTFKIPKVIEGHDMSSCDTVRIHYITINPETSAKYPDVYDVRKKDITPDGNDHLQFSWLIDQHVTRYASPVSFVIQFACTRTVTVGEEQKLVYDYSWSTIPYTQLTVSDGFINNKSDDADAFVDEYNSIVTQWHNEIEEAIARSDNRTITKLEQTTIGEDDGDENVWTATFGDGVTTSTLTVKNGSKGSDGKSAYQVAKDNGFDGSEQEWVETLATSYVECLKGRTIAQEEYDALPEEEKNREGYLYVIKDAEIHVHSADTATTAAGYTADGDIAKAISEINQTLKNSPAGEHNHDDKYAAIGHTHTGYAVEGHNHDDKYAAQGHTHTELTDHETRIKALENRKPTSSGPTISGTAITGCGTRSETASVRYTLAIVDPVITYDANHDDDQSTHYFTITNYNATTVTCNYKVADGTTKSVEMAAGASQTVTHNSDYGDCYFEAKFILDSETSKVISGTYDTSTYVEPTIPDGVGNRIVNSKPQTVTGKFDSTITNLIITSCTIHDPTGYGTYQVTTENITHDTSEDGKEIIFDISGYSEHYIPGEWTATISYEYTYEDGYVFGISGERSTKIGVSSGKTYLIKRLPYYDAEPRYYETAIIYVDDYLLPPGHLPPCLSTPFSDGARVVITFSDYDGSWYARAIDSSGTNIGIPYVAMTEH